MGFSEDVERIANATPASRQTLLFSATLEGVVGSLAAQLMKEPKKITIAAAKTKHENIEQRMLFADDVAHKNKLLSHILTGIDVNQAVVFTATKRDADSLADTLAAQGHAVAALHGDMSQRERNRTLQNLRRGNLRVLVATDVAARGIDVPGISHVINFDLPKFAEDYVHRIGRTGRGGASGIAISFASNRDALLLKRIERYTEQRIDMHTIEGLEPKFKLRAEPAGNRPRSAGGKRRGFGDAQGYGSNRGGNFGGNRSSAFSGNGNNGGAGFHHSTPDSRHSHVGRKEGHGQWHGQPDRSSGQSRPEGRSFGGNRGPAGGAKRGGDRPSYALGRGHNSGNKR